FYTCFFSLQICTPDLVVFLACTNSHLKERLQKRAEQQGRPDDNPKAIDRRLTNFKQNTIPLVKYFQERGLIVTVRLLLTIVPLYVRKTSSNFLLGCKM
ncbi:Adenylate kinase isoenzyme 5, partial [Xenoophorus captivus]